MRPPTYLADKKCHEFTLESPPTFTHFTARKLELPLESPELSTEFRQFCDSFLVEAGTFFSRPLPTDTFLQRLHHEWNADEYDPDDIQLDGTQTFRVGWIPARIRFSTTRYTIHWDLSQFELVVPGKKAPPPRPPTPPPEMPASVYVPVAVPAPPPAEAPPLEPPVEAQIPFEAPNGTSRLERLKQKVRKARLRVALAQLRAERLAELYHVRYGAEADTLDSDSDLSYEPEEAARKI